MATYVVWLPILPSDERAAWRDDLISGSGVMQFWDEERVVGTWITNNVDGCLSLGPIAWDSFYLFDGSGAWNESLGPILSCGAPVIGQTETLAADIKKLLKGHSEGRARVKIEVQYIEGCPNHEPTVALINAVARDLAIDVHVIETIVGDPEEAVALRFLGSPTVLVDGKDIDPETAGRGDYGMACRTYHGQGFPPRAWIENAVRR